MSSQSGDPTYTLTCDNCGQSYLSQTAFPAHQLCPACKKGTPKQDERLLPNRIDACPECGADLTKYMRPEEIEAIRAEERRKILNDLLLMGEEMVLCRDKVIREFLLGGFWDKAVREFKQGKAFEAIKIEADSLLEQLTAEAIARAQIKKFLEWLKKRASFHSDDHMAYMRLSWNEWRELEEIGSA
jgi:hypothetical protein